MRRPRAYLLILTILAITALFFIAVLMSGFLSGQHSLGLQMEDSVKAEEAASAGIEAAIDELDKNPDWTAGFQQVKLKYSGATYDLSFSGAPGVPRSTNNAAGLTATKAYDGQRVVPPGMVHLVCVGRDGPARCLQEAMVAMGARLMSQDFTTRPDLSGWSMVQGRYAMVSRGVLFLGQTRGSGRTRVVTGSNSWSNYAMTVVARAEQGPDRQGFGFYFRETTKSNGKLSDGYLFSYDARKQQFTLSATRAMGTPHPFVSVPLQDTSLAWHGRNWFTRNHTYRIQASGDQLSVSIDGHAILSATDSTYSSGKIGLFTDSNTMLEVSSVQVTGTGVVTAARW